MKSLILLLSLICLKTPKIDFKVQQDSCTKHYDETIHSFVYSYVDQMPEFPGGPSKFYSYLFKNLKFSPDTTKSWQSRVPTTFFIDTLGNIINISIDNKVPKDYTSLDLGFIEVLKKCPKWKPAKCNGKKVVFRYRINPIIEPN
ncbi:energy transducer TonB [Pedobacter nototheniae]|uniref:hypothetical protein n=1 Tax=Pedobacter nototheniae TaxID=2488994 RepID=UPI001038E02B|nr:hypothetical protein [Pedobacter nototheniae]